MRLNLDWLSNLLNPPDFQVTNSEETNAPSPHTTACLETDRHHGQAVVEKSGEKKTVSAQNLHIPERIQVRLTR
jgi:hypothetical protein